MPGKANDVLSSIASQNKPVETPATPATPTPAAQVPATPAVSTPPVTPPVAATPPVEVPPTEATPAVPTTPVATEPTGPIDNWDSETIPQAPVLAVPDFSELGKAIGLEGIKTREEFEGKIKEALKREIPLTGVPDPLKKAVELAKNGGDYLQFLKVSQVDYSKIPPDQIYENWVKTNLTAPDGTVDAQQVSDFLASKTPLEKKLEGTRLQNDYIAWQRNQEDALIRDNEARKQLANMKLKEALDKVNDINGFKIKASDKAETYDRITSGKMQQDLFYDKEGNFDYEKMAKVDLLIRKSDKMFSYLSDKVRNSTIREKVAEIQNVQITPTTEKPTADPIKIDPITNYIEALRKQRMGS